eukprot:g38635.t1
MCNIGYPVSNIRMEEDNPKSEFNDENLLLSTFNIFLAGTDTTSSTMRWGFLLFLKYPDVQGVRVCGTPQNEPFQTQKEQYTSGTANTIAADANASISEANTTDTEDEPTVTAAATAYPAPPTAEMCIR